MSGDSKISSLFQLEYLDTSPKLSPVKKQHTIIFVILTTQEVKGRKVLCLPAMSQPSNMQGEQQLPFPATAEPWSAWSEYSSMSEMEVKYKGWGSLAEFAWPKSVGQQVSSERADRVDRYRSFI